MRCVLNDAPGDGLHQLLSKPKYEYVRDQVGAACARRAIYPLTRRRGLNGAGFSQTVIIKTLNEK